MGGRASRVKGHNFEREVSHLFRLALRTDSSEVKRGLSQPRGGTAEEPDVVLPEYAPLWLECKVGKLTNPRAALKQAQKALKDQKVKKIPVAVCKDDRTEPVAMLPLTAFAALVQLCLYRYGSHDLLSVRDELEQAWKKSVRVTSEET